MILRVFGLACGVLSVLPAQNAPPRAKAADYPSHVTLSGVEIGAEYLVHSIPVEKGIYFSKEYLIVEVGIFPLTPDGVEVRAGQFTLRINHRKSVLMPDTAGTVAAALKYPDWDSQRGVTGQVGPVTISSPPDVGRFPGDPRQPRPLPAPAPHPVDVPPDLDGSEPNQPMTIERSIANAALPEGPANRPAKGLLFFHYTGKTKSIRSVELEYDGGSGKPKATISLF